MFERNSPPRAVVDLLESLPSNGIKLPEVPAGYSHAKAMTELGAKEMPAQVLFAMAQDQKNDPDRPDPPPVKVVPKAENPGKKADEPAKKAEEPAPKKAAEPAPKGPTAPTPTWTPQQLEESAAHIYWCFTGINHEENMAIAEIRRARDSGNLPALEAAWRTTYPNEWGLLDYVSYYLDVWDPRQSANGNGPGSNGWSGAANNNPVYVNSERAALMEVFHGSQAARDAAVFYNRCHGATDNQALLSFLETVAGYNREKGTVTPEGAARFQKMIAAYNQFGWQTQNSWDDYKKARPTSSSTPPTDTYFDATIWYELDGTGLAQKASEVITAARKGR